MTRCASRSAAGRTRRVPDRRHQLPEVERGANPSDTSQRSAPVILHSLRPGRLAHSAMPSTATTVLSHSPSGPPFAAHPRVKVRDLIKILVAERWRELRTAGSHRHFGHPEKPGVVTVAGRPGDELPTGTLRAIYRQAGLDWRRKRQ